MFHLVLKAVISFHKPVLKCVHDLSSKVMHQLCFFSSFSLVSHWISSAMWCKSWEKTWIQVKGVDIFKAQRLSVRAPEEENRTSVPSPPPPKKKKSSVCQFPHFLIKTWRCTFICWSLDVVFERTLYFILVIYIQSRCWTSRI